MGSRRALVRPIDVSGRLSPTFCCVRPSTDAPMGMRHQAVVADRSVRVLGRQVLCAGVECSANDLVPTARGWSSPLALPQRPSATTLIPNA